MNRRRLIAVLKKVRYALCPMPYALCPVVPHMRARKAIASFLVAYVRRLPLKLMMNSALIF